MSLAFNIAALIFKGCTTITWSADYFFNAAALSQFPGYGMLTSTVSNYYNFHKKNNIRNLKNSKQIPYYAVCLVEIFLTKKSMLNPTNSMQ